MPKRPLLTAAALVLVVASGGEGAQARRVPHGGEEVIVQWRTPDARLRGRLIDLSPESVSILTDAGRVELPLEEVLRVDTTHDAVLNGAVIGAVVLGGWCAFVCGQGAGGSVAPVVLGNAALGAIIGAGIDAAHKGRKPIYVRPAKSGAVLQMQFRF